MGVGSSSTKASSTHAFDFYSDSEDNDTFEKRMRRVEARFAAAAAKRAALLENAIKNTIQVSIHDSMFNAREAQKLVESFTRATNAYIRDQTDGRNRVLMSEYSAASKRYMQEARAILQQIQGENASQLAGFQEQIRDITAILSSVEGGLKGGEERAKGAERNAGARKRGVKTMPMIREEENNNATLQEGGSRRHICRMKRRQTRRK